MIVGTAGHIDHGKTTLVRALTGVDTDRLPEEKARGISIELGYAYLPLPAQAGGPPAPAGADEVIGFIDVPGHERLVHTMVSGATGIDFALLLVAADDGVMPQTREHLAVLSLLGLARGAVVVTKADRAEPARVQAVADEARALVAGTPLAGAPVLAVSATTGAGLAELKALLFDAARQRPAARAVGGSTPVEPKAFRLAIDRAFTLAGVGTVVTGTAHAGSVAVGDELVLLPAAGAGGAVAGVVGPGERVRVRSLHAQNRAAAQGHAGERCALALAGVARERIARGQWLVSSAAALQTDRFDAELTLWPGEARALRSGTPVMVHLGAGVTPGTLAVLDGDVLEPGATARVQLVLRAPVGAWWGERVVLRDASASRTLAGGRVLDALAPARYRRTPQRLAELQALAQPEAAARLQALLAVSPLGVEVRRFAAAQGLVQLPAAGAGAGDVADPTAAVATADAASTWLLAPPHAEHWRSQALAALAAFHQRAPDEIGPDLARLRRLAAPRLAEPLWRGLVARWQRDGVLALRGSFVHLPAHGVQLSATEERIAQKVAPRLAEAGFEGAWARDLARDAGESEPLMRATLARLAQRGELHQVVKDLYYPAATMARLAALAREVAAAQPGAEVTAARFRDATQLGRKRAIQILEYFDRVGLLRRVGDVHRLRADSALFVQEVAA